MGTIKEMIEQGVRDQARQKTFYEDQKRLALKKRLDEINHEFDTNLSPFLIELQKSGIVDAIDEFISTIEIIKEGTPNIERVVIARSDSGQKALFIGEQPPSADIDYGKLYSFRNADSHKKWLSYDEKRAGEAEEKKFKAHVKSWWKNLSDTAPWHDIEANRHGICSPTSPSSLEFLTAYTNVEAVGFRINWDYYFDPGDEFHSTEEGYKYHGDILIKKSEKGKFLLFINDNPILDPSEINANIARMYIESRK